ncbi:MAG: sel1 repeat family protein [Gammaproteobacteria bacterium]|nr:sel1 repeat family protein [Gammaproteobacteria bacterium]
MNIKFLFAGIALLVININSSFGADAYDSSASVFLFQKQMAKRGNAESQFKLGLMYETGSGVSQSTVLAISWYKKAERQNYKPASNRLTYLEIKKTGFNDKHIKWLKDLKKDARFNEGEALFLLGQMYSEGTGVNKSLTRSLKLLRKAAGGNIPGADTEIARVEEELNQLQKQYISDTEKQTKKAPVILPAKKAVKKVKPPAARPTGKVSSTGVKKTSAASTQKTKKQLTKKPLTKSNKTTNKPLKNQSRDKKTHTVNKQKTLNKTVKPVKTKPLSTNNEKTNKDNEHPMDTICGGRNRFSRACR